MIKTDRHKRIISILKDCDELSITELARRLGRVSAVTIRRDVNELAERGLLMRTHGGDAWPELAAAPGDREPDDPIQTEIGDVDAIVLPPIEGRGADTLRSMARRRDVPFLAKSSQQDGGVYLGPDNFAVGRELGNRAGRALAGLLAEARILLARSSGCRTREAAVTASSRASRRSSKGRSGAGASTAPAVSGSRSAPASMRLPYILTSMSPLE